MYDLPTSVPDLFLRKGILVQSFGRGLALTRLLDQESPPHIRLQPRNRRTGKTKAVVVTKNDQPPDQNDRNSNVNGFRCREAVRGSHFHRRIMMKNQNRRAINWFTSQAGRQQSGNEVSREFRDSRQNLEIPSPRRQLGEALSMMQRIARTIISGRPYRHEFPRPNFEVMAAVP